MLPVSDREGLMALVLWPDVQLVQLNTDPLEISGAVAAYPRQGSGHYFEILFNTHSEIFPEGEASLFETR